MMGWWGNGWGWSAAGSWWMIAMMLGWAAIIGLAVWGITRLTGSASGTPVNFDSARAILDRRFASGELDADQYADARKVLESHGR